MFCIKIINLYNPKVTIHGTDKEWWGVYNANDAHGNRNAMFIAGKKANLKSSEEAEKIFNKKLIRKWLSERQLQKVSDLAWRTYSHKILF